MKGKIHGELSSGGAAERCEIGRFALPEHVTALILLALDVIAAAAHGV